MFLQGVGLDQDTSLVLTQVTVSAIVVALIEWMKRTNRLSWINVETEKLNRAVAFVGATVSAIGIHMTWNHGANPGSYLLGISGLTVMGVTHGLWTVTKSFVMQQIIFHSTVKPKSLTGKVTIPERNIVAVVEEPK
jgi:hypothetical protein